MLSFIDKENKITITTLKIKGRATGFILINGKMEQLFYPADSEIGKRYLLPIRDATGKIISYFSSSTSTKELIKHLEQIEGLEFLGENI